MDRNFEKVMNTYQAVYEELNDDEGPMVAAVLTACVIAEDISDRWIENLSHQLALGIRHGLFGRDALPNAHINPIAGVDAYCAPEECSLCGNAKRQ